MSELYYTSIVFNVLFLISLVGLFVKVVEIDADRTLLLSQKAVLKARVSALEMRIQMSWQAERQLATIRQSSSLDPSKVKRLLGLCHPDKHNNSKMSTEMTQWLLEQRR